MSISNRDAEALDAQLSGCTHCGLCLESCPTYSLWGREADSPRGRISLTQDALRLGVPTDALAEHIDACVGCARCTSACPEEVPFDLILEAARARLHAGRDAGLPGRRRRLTEATLSSSGRLRALAPGLGAARRMGADRLPEPMRTLASLPLRPPTRRQLAARVPEFSPATEPRRGRVLLLLGCTNRVFASDTARAAVSVLAAEGYDVITPDGVGCCGGWARECGDRDAMEAHANRTLNALRAVGRVDAVLTLGGMCGATMKRPVQAAGAQASPPVQDVTEFLAAAGRRAPLGGIGWRVAVHRACTLTHGLGTRDLGAELLAGIPGLELIEPADDDVGCCGGRGLYPARRPEAAAALGNGAASLLLASGADAIVSADPACAEQLNRHARARGRQLPVMHPLELLRVSQQRGRQ